ncbi:MAG: amidohydrolase [Thaumarchaeota archaeon]|nr:amidohydrolase [Candidatus Calditenuaceae archaeon]MDW8187395.1 amidohydrolase [Nitrososphaerota archaeon]
MKDGSGKVERVLLRSRVVVPVTRKGTLISKGAVLIDNGEIVYVGEQDGAAGRWSKDDLVIDEPYGVVLPGFIDTHVHLAQALIRGFVPDSVTLIPWLRDWVWRLQGVYGHEDGKASAELCVLEMLKTGTTTFLEAGLHSRYGIDGIAESVLSSGIRAVLSKKVMDMKGYATVEDALPEGMVEDGEECIRQFLDARRKWAGAGGGRLDFWMGLRTPGAVSDEMFERVSQLAEETGSGVTMHLAEVKEDIRYFASRGFTPATFLRRCGLLGRKRVYVHCVWLSEGDMEAFAASGTSVAHCPSSNAKLGSGVAPVVRMLEKGVNVSLGCDGGPSNDSYDMVREMKMAALFQKALHGPQSFTAWDALEMATVNGARALGLENLIGSLEVGKRGDVVVIRTKVPSLTPYTDPVSLIVFAATGRDVAHVLVDGQPVVTDGKVLTLDEERVLRKAEERFEVVKGKFLIGRT